MVEFFRGICKPLCKDGFLYVRCLIYAVVVWILNGVYIEIGEFSTLLGGYR